jgi:hypothetical protein
MWAFYAVAATTLIYLVFVRPMQRQRKDPLVRPPFSGGLSRQRAAERQMETLLVELSDMARQITAQLDTRAAKLEALMKEADQKIAALQNQPQNQPIAPAGNGDFVPPLGAAPDSEDNPRHRDVYALADAGMPAGEIARRLSRPGGEVDLILALRPRK